MAPAKRTSTIDRASRGRHARRGYTLVEAMIASLMLSVSVVGVSGTVLSSYQNDAQSKRQYDAVRAAESLKSELAALPMQPASTSDVGITDFASYNDQASPDQVMVATAAKAASKQQAAGTSGTPGASQSNTGLLGSVVGVVNGVLGGLLGGGGSNPTPPATPPETPSVTVAGPSSTAGLQTGSVTATRQVTVERRSTLNGAASSTGELAIITIDVAVGPNQTVRLKRLVSATEAAANAGAGSVP